jgi:hypothetical protein
VFEGDDRVARADVTRQGDNYVLVFEDRRPSATDRKPSDTTLLIKKVSDDVYIAQATVIGHIVASAIIRKRGEELERLYCGNYSDEQRQRLGIEVLKDDLLGNILHAKICAVTSLDQLAALSKEEANGTEPIRKVKIISVQKDQGK